jgi:hypothetical protein
MGDESDKSMTALDRFVLASLTTISVALILGAAISDEPRLFLGYLAGAGGLAVFYFFIRS